MRHTLLTSSHIGDLLILARDAGKGVMGIYDETSKTNDGEVVGLDVSYKADTSPVTAADMLAHRIIVDGLSRITPDIPVVSEEDADSLLHRTPTGYFWLIDPLDGTKEFISHNGEFTINIALIEDGAAVFGVVLAPCLDLLYWGGKEYGAFRDTGGVVESLVSIDLPAHQDRQVRVVASRSHMNGDTTQYISRFGACELIQAGSSLKFCRIAEGSADVYPRLGPTNEWDTAAAQAIVEAAGGQVRRLGGESLSYGKSEVLNPHFIATSARFEQVMQDKPEGT